MYKQLNLTKETQGRGLYDITEEIKYLVNGIPVNVGLCHIFLLHTSASLIICENFDPQVQTDLEAFMSRLIPDGDPLFKHVAEGPDDMPSHIRNVLTTTFLTIPVHQGKLVLGRWQGIALWEHRQNAYHRKMILTVCGD